VNPVVELVETRRRFCGAHCAEAFAAFGGAERPPSGPSAAVCRTRAAIPRRSCDTRERDRRAEPGSRIQPG
jgi:hypothetical protein